jgi:hypothetical protein
VADRRIGARADGGRRRAGDGDARGMRSLRARGGARAGPGGNGAQAGAASGGLRQGWARRRSDARAHDDSSSDGEEEMSLCVRGMALKHLIPIGQNTGPTGIN